MSDNSVNISLKSILWVLGLVAITTIFIVILNQFDNRKKFKQFETVYNQILSSDFPDRLAPLIAHYSENDTLTIEQLEQNLEALIEDIKEIEYSTLYIKESDYFFKIYSNGYRSNSTKKISYLPEQHQKFTDYLDENDKPDIDSLYALTADDNRISIALKIDRGYLILWYFRE